MVADGHFVFAEQRGAAAVVIEQGIRFRNRGITEELEVAWGWGPVAMRRLVLGHKEERLVWVPSVLEPIEGLFGDDIGAITIVAFPRTVHLDEIRIVITALAREDLPIIETSRVRIEMPLAEHDGLVAGALQMLRKSGLRTVEAVSVAEEPIEMTVLAGKDRGAGRAADRIGAE